MGIFGWSLPPGCTTDDAFGTDIVCDVCYAPVGECICPECPVCSAVGDLACYAVDGHGLIRTTAQIASAGMVQAAQRLDHTSWDLAGITSAGDLSEWERIKEADRARREREQALSDYIAFASM